jgi:hypothetical protein
MDIRLRHLTYVKNRPGKRLTVTVNLSDGNEADVTTTDSELTKRGKHVKADKSDK